MKTTTNLLGTFYITTKEYLTEHGWTPETLFPLITPHLNHHFNIDIKYIDDPGTDNYLYIFNTLIASKLAKSNYLTTNIKKYIDRFIRNVIPPDTVVEIAYVSHATYPSLQSAINKIREEYPDAIFIDESNNYVTDKNYVWGYQHPPHIMVYQNRCDELNDIKFADIIPF